MTKDLPLIVITGATASGKTNFAIKLAQKIGAEIISADSRIVYKDFDIVSAKPTIEEMEGVKHHLIDIINPDKDFSAGDFVEHAKNAIKDIQSKNKRVIIAGGTWFYIKSLLDDEKLPNIKPDFELRKKLEKNSIEDNWNLLNKLDNKRANAINKNNKEKVIRSIEMCISLNGPISKYKREVNNEFNSLWFMLDIERKILYDNINKRVDIMIKKGLIEEFEKNIEKWGKENKIIQNTIGYQEFIEFGKTPFAVDKIKQHTRNFAKRQLTYFRSNQKIKRLLSFDELFLLNI